MPQYNLHRRITSSDLQPSWNERQTEIDPEKKENTEFRAGVLGKLVTVRRQVKVLSETSNSRASGSKDLRRNIRRTEAEIVKWENHPGERTEQIQQRLLELEMLLHAYTLQLMELTRSGIPDSIPSAQELTSWSKGTDDLRAEIEVLEGETGGHQKTIQERAVQLTKFKKLLAYTERSEGAEWEGNRPVYQHVAADIQRDPTLNLPKHLGYPDDFFKMQPPPKPAAPSDEKNVKGNEGKDKKGDERKDKGTESQSTVLTRSSSRAEWLAASANAKSGDTVTINGQECQLTDVLSYPNTQGYGIIRTTTGNYYTDEITSCEFKSPEPESGVNSQSTDAEWRAYFGAEEGCTGETAYAKDNDPVVIDGHTYKFIKFEDAVRNGQDITIVTYLGRFTTRAITSCHLPKREERMEAIKAEKAKASKTSKLTGADCRDLNKWRACLEGLTRGDEVRIQQTSGTRTGKFDKYNSSSGYFTIYLIGDKRRNYTDEITSFEVLDGRDDGVEGDGDWETLERKATDYSTAQHWAERCEALTSGEDVILIDKGQGEKKHQFINAANHGQYVELNVRLISSDGRVDWETKTFYSDDKSLVSVKIPRRESNPNSKTRETTSAKLSDRYNYGW
jgi:hypothetical protein